MPSAFERQRLLALIRLTPLLNTLIVNIQILKILKEKSKQLKKKDLT
jgi:hypothetical protein